MATEQRLDLIDRKALIRRICAERDEVEIKTACDIGYHNGLNMGASMTINAPTIEARPVVHGRWIHDYNNLYGCSECGERETNSPKKLKNYCPNCGADMKSKGD